MTTFTRDTLNHIYNDLTIEVIELENLYRLELNTYDTFQCLAAKKDSAYNLLESLWIFNLLTYEEYLKELNHVKEIYNDGVEVHSKAS